MMCEDANKKISNLEKECDELRNQKNALIAKTKELEEQVRNYQFSMMKIDDALVEFLGVTHEIMDKPHEFEKILKEKAEVYAIGNYPFFPIKMADKLIDTYTKEAYKCVCHYEELDRQCVSALRQIAEHLLIYCNANESEEK